MGRFSFPRMMLRSALIANVPKVARRQFHFPSVSSGFRSARPVQLRFYAAKDGKNEGAAPAPPPKEDTSLNAYTEEQRDKLRNIERRAEQIYKQHLEKIDHFSLVPKERVSLPMVLVVGNHSSGKSTFINYLLGQKEQETGVAPTDDSFTVITRGPAASDQDGPSLMNDPKFAFGDLRQYGPNFLNHFRLKTRKLAETSIFPFGMMVVDTPGMIDTPLKSEAGNRGARGYDFLKVVRWFAERSDVILLLFDPNNPGTTGETLDVLTESLADLDHKFLLILNKVDQFTQVHDFARAYGSLCWNLAKVIHRKDIPRIYTMFTPTLYTSRGQSSPDLPSHMTSQPLMSVSDVHHEELKNKESDIKVSGIPLAAFNRTRDEVIIEIMNAPQRRVDNIVTQLDESISKLRIATTVSNALRSEFSSKRRAYYFSWLLTLLVCPTTVGGAFYMGLPYATMGGAAAVAFSVCGGLVYATYASLREHKASALANIDKLFKKLYFKELDENYDLQFRWERIRPRIVKALSLVDDLSAIPAVPAKQVKALEEISKKDIRQMRQECSDLRISRHK